MSRSHNTIIELDHWLGQKAKIDSIDLSPFKIDRGPLYLLREDRIMDEASGNKLRKLLPNLKAALSAGINRIVTFGGAYSNHIAATAAAGQMFGFETIGLIRGEELAQKINENPTLSQAHRIGMKLYFLNRSEYKRRSDPVYLDELRARFAPCLIIPEGGSNDLAIEGVALMTRALPKKFRILCTPIGTGGTMAGVLNGAHLGRKVWGFSVLKGIDFRAQMSRYGNDIPREFFDEYHFGGYAKANNELIDFINNFKAQTGIALDPVYTGKMMFGLIDLLRKNPSIKAQEILAIHTGGLQGVAGFNKSNKALLKIQ